jgi:hypothetical protein
MLTISPNHPLALVDNAVRGALIVGDVLYFSMASAVTSVSAPSGASEVTLTADGTGFVSSALDVPGVYSWTAQGTTGAPVLVRTIVFPVAALSHYELAPHTEQQQRLVLQALARDVVLGVADATLAGENWNSVALIGQPADRGNINLRNYGA